MDASQEDRNDHERAETKSRDCVQPTILTLHFVKALPAVVAVVAAAADYYYYYYFDSLQILPSAEK